MPYYQNCKQCGNDSEGDIIFRCTKCQYRYCSNCVIFRDPLIGSSTWHCPNCDERGWNKIGEIKGTSSRSSDYSSSSSYSYDDYVPESKEERRARIKEENKETRKETLPKVLGLAIVFFPTAYYGREFIYTHGLGNVLIGLVLLFAALLSGLCLLMMLGLLLVTFTDD